MTNYAHGKHAEAKATDYLHSKGWEIVEQNWKTEWCEIDIIAKHQSRIYFVEVKYRMSNSQGTGLDYITNKKLHQMARAAEGWTQIHRWAGDYQLAAIEVSGENYQITNFVTDLF